MVYCGKPSKGCSNCRERKIRCDQREPGCGQCEKRQQECPGYRNLVDLMFRDESSHVIKKAKAKAKRKGHLIIESGLSSPSPRSRHSLTPEPRSAKALSLVVPGPRTPSTPGSVWSHDDSNSLMSPESGSWPVTPAMALFYNLAPSLQEHGLAYFYSRYVNRDETACHQRFDFIFEIWKPATSASDRELDCVLASMTAVGLMGLASMTRAGDMMEAAQKSYGTALQLTNKALEDPVEALKDTTMLSILILGVFEMMTENLPRRQTIEIFQNHVNGAIALARERGATQFRTKAQKRMFSMLCQRVLISCIQRNEPVPEPMVQLWTEVASHLDPRNPTKWVTELIFQILQTRYDIRTGAMADSVMVMERLLAIEEQFQTRTGQIPASWQPRIFELSRDHDAVHGRIVHAYPSLWHATVWNVLRTARIFVLETILSYFHADSQTYSPRLSSERYVDAFNHARKKLKRMIHDVLASVPQHLGLVNTDGSVESSSPMSPPISSVEIRTTPSPPTSPSTRSDSVSSAGFSPREFNGQPSGATIMDMTLARNAEDEAHRYMLLVSADSTIVWPLYIIGLSSACADEIKSYTINRLRTLYMETGIRQADSIANILEEHETWSEWLDAPFRPTPLATPMLKLEDFGDYGSYGFQLPEEGLDFERQRDEHDVLYI